MSPDHPDFETLPRKEQALIYRSLGWDLESLMDEFDVTHVTLRRWFNPAYAQEQRDRSKRWSLGVGREKRRIHKQKYDASPKGQAARERTKEALRQKRALTKAVMSTNVGQ